jgi:hypothetical protein
MNVRLLAIAFVVIGLSIGAFFGFVILASESGEVITIRTQDAASDWHPTRLWVVDHDGAEWTRTGHPGKGWFVRLKVNPVVELERNGVASSRRAVPVSDPGVSRAVNDAYKEKYGIADWIVALSGDATQRVVIRLDRVEP